MPSVAPISHTFFHLIAWKFGDDGNNSAWQRSGPPLRLEQSRHQLRLLIALLVSEEMVYFSPCEFVPIFVWKCLRQFSCVDGSSSYVILQCEKFKMKSKFSSMSPGSATYWPQHHLQVWQSETLFCIQCAFAEKPKLCLHQFLSHQRWQQRCC